MAAEYNFRSITKGDTFLSRKLWLKKDGVAIDLTGATICWQIKSSYGASPAHTFGYTISDPAAGEITLDMWNVNIPPYKYLHDLRITMPDGSVGTYLRGKFIVTQYVSECQI